MLDDLSVAELEDVIVTDVNGTFDTIITKLLLPHINEYPGYGELVQSLRRLEAIPDEWKLALGANFSMSTKGSVRSSTVTLSSKIGDRWFLKVESHPRAETRVPGGSAVSGRDTFTNELTRELTLNEQLQWPFIEFIKDFIKLVPDYHFIIKRHGQPVEYILVCTDGNIDGYFYITFRILTMVDITND